MMLVAEAPPKANEEAAPQLQSELAKELVSCRILLVLGILLCLGSIAAEIFVSGPLLEDKGMWSTFALVGFAIAVVFGLILKRAHEHSAH